MKRGIKKILNYLPPFFLDIFEMIFDDAAENHLRFAKADIRKFRSYTQLKRHQKKVRMTIASTGAVIFALLAGLTIGPLFLPQQIEPEVYIPNGKGDILLANISKSQVTVIFKTLDSANGNKPLATKAFVEFYADQNYSKLIRRTSEDDYAVTHIIPVDSLQEANNYFIKIIAKDASVPQHIKMISSWGNGNDPIKVYTTGDFIAGCVDLAKNNQLTVATAQNVEQVNIAPVNDESNDESNTSTGLEISNVKNESYLQPHNKVQTIVSWNTNLPASTTLLYGETSAQEKTEVPANDQMFTRHQVVLTTLKAGTTYYYKVKSIDNSGNTVFSDEYSLRTPRPQETIIEKISDNFKAIFRQIKPR